MTAERGQRTPIPPPSQEDLERLEELTDRLPADLQAFRDRGLLNEVRRFRIEQTLSNRTRSLVTVLDGVHDPHNQAAVMRTSEALGLQEIHVIAGDEQRIRPSPRVTQNAHKWLDLQRHSTFDQAAESLRKRGFEIWGAGLAESSIPLDELPVERPLALVFGNESVGLQPQTLSSCDGSFEIPLRGFSQSLNVSVAAALALWSVLCERESRFGNAGDLDEEERMRLRRKFYYRAVGLKDTTVLEADE